MPHDEWWTKKHLFNHLCQKYSIYPELDVAATKENKLCDAYFCKDEEPDGLTGSWQGYRAVWCNPPNSLLSKFIPKAVDEWRLGATVLMVAPCGAFGTGYFKESIFAEFKKSPFNKVVIEPILPRPEFLERGQHTINGNRNSYMEIVLR